MFQPNDLFAFDNTQYMISSKEISTNGEITCAVRFGML